MEKSRIIRLGRKELESLIRRHFSLMIVEAETLEVELARRGFRVEKNGRWIIVRANGGPSRKIIAGRLSEPEEVVMSRLALLAVKWRDFEEIAENTPEWEE